MDSSPKTTRKRSSTSASAAAQHHHRQLYDVSQLKQNLQGWKLVLLPTYSFFHWKRQIDPVIIIFLNSFFFSLLAYYTPSIVTIVSLLGLFYLVLETFVPIVANTFFSKAEWNSVSESQYTRICEQISILIQHVRSFRSRVETVRRERQSLYFLIVFFFLVFCIYVGQIVDNTLLTYLASLSIMLSPGVNQHGLVNKLLNKLKRTLGMKIIEIEEQQTTYASNTRHHFSEKSIPINTVTTTNNTSSRKNSRSPYIAQQQQYVTTQNVDDIDFVDNDNDNEADLETSNAEFEFEYSKRK